MPTPAAAIPDNLAEWMRNIEKRVRRAETAALSAEQANISEGDVTIDGTGTLRVVGYGQSLLEVGALTGLDDEVTGLPQLGTIMRRQNGVPAVILADQSGLAFGVNAQSLTLYDSNGNAVVQEAADGNGLGVPWHNWHVFPARPVDYLSTQSTSFVDIWNVANDDGAHSRLMLEVYVSLGGGATQGAVRVVKTDTGTVPPGGGVQTFTGDTSRAFNLDGSYTGQFGYTVQLRVDSGAGTARCAVSFAQGQEQF